MGRNVAEESGAIDRNGSDTVACGLLNDRVAAVRGAAEAADEKAVVAVLVRAQEVFGGLNDLPNAGYVVAKPVVEAMTRRCAAVHGRDNIRADCIGIGLSETPLAGPGLDARRVPKDAREAAIAASRRKVPLRAEQTDPFDVAAGAGVLRFRLSHAHRRRGLERGRWPRVRPHLARRRGGFAPKGGALHV